MKSNKYLFFYLILFSFIWTKPKMVINIWHQMLYENRKVLREVCDNYENMNPQGAQVSGSVKTDPENEPLLY